MRALAISRMVGRESSSLRGITVKVVSLKRCSKRLIVAAVALVALFTNTLSTRTSFSIKLFSVACTWLVSSSSEEKLSLRTTNAGILRL